MIDGLALLGAFDRKIHGSYKLPEGYELALLPSNAKVIPDVEDSAAKEDLAHSQNAPKVVIAIVQAL